MDFQQLARKYEKNYLEDLNRLVEIESVRDKEHAAKGEPFGPACRKALDTFLSIGERDGFKTEDVDGYAGVISWGDQKDTLGILGHLDIVPLGEGWTKDPLKVTVNDGYVFGRGVMDDKGPALAAYYALKMLKDENIPLKRRIMLIAGCDEESGMECMDYYVEHGEIPQMGFVPDADFPVIYGEKGGAHVKLHSNDSTIIKSLKAGSRPNIVIGKAEAVLPSMNEEQEKQFDFYLKTNDLKGSVERKENEVVLHIEGIPAHAAMPYLGINAALHLMNFIGTAYDDQLAKDLYSVLKDWQGKAAGIYKDGMYMGFLTMNTGIVDIENQKADILIDIRYPNDVDAAFIMNGFNTTLKDKKSDIKAELVSDSKPLFVDPNSKLVQDLMQSYQKYTKDTFSPAITIGGGTYARKFDNFVSFGPELPNDVKTTDQFVGGCHQRDEGVKLENLINAIAIYADAIVRLAG